MNMNQQAKSAADAVSDVFAEVYGLLGRCDDTVDLLTTLGKTRAVSRTTLVAEGLMAAIVGKQVNKDAVMQYVLCDMALSYAEAAVMYVAHERGDRLDDYPLYRTAVMHRFNSTAREALDDLRRRMDQAGVR